MPQLVKGGKFVFGWSEVRRNGSITIPPKAIDEYGFDSDQNVILISGSGTSGGFGLTTKGKLANSAFSDIVTTNPELFSYRIPAGTPVSYSSKIYCWTYLSGNHIEVPPGMLELYGIHPGNMLLTVRGSSLALGFIVRGPLFKEAVKHDGIEIFK